MGAREPRYQVSSGRLRGKFVLLGQHAEESAEARRALTVDRSGLWYATRQLDLEWSAELKEKISFPISLCSIKETLKWARTEGYKQIDLLLLVVTGGPEKGTYVENGPVNDDTWFAGQLLKKYLDISSDFAGAVKRTATCQLGPNAHLYNQAQRYIDQNPLFLEELPKYNRIYMCQSPGLPMVNAAILRRALKANREGLTAFQVVEPASKMVLYGGGLSTNVISVPTVDLLYEWVFGILPELLERFDYRGAINLVRSLPYHPRHDKKHQILQLLGPVRARWMLDLKRSGISLPDDRFGELLLKMWLSCDVIESWVRTKEYAEATWRAADIVLKLRECAAAKSVNLPELATESTVDAKKLKEALPSVYESLDPDPGRVRLRSDGPLRRILKNPPRAQWREFFRKTEQWLILRDTRNRSVHEFEPITGKEFNEKICHPLRLTPSELAEALREMLREYCSLADCMAPSPTEPFLDVNAEITGITEQEDSGHS